MNYFNGGGRSSVYIVGIGGTMREHSSTLFALERALSSAAAAGAATALLDLRELELPIYTPGVSLEAQGPNVRHFIESIRQADAILLSTAAYHGTLAGITKNALDYLQLLAGGERPYLHEKVVGLIATAGGDMAGVNAVNAMVHSVHSLRGTLVPLHVSIPQAWKGINVEDGFIEPRWAERLDQLGKLVVKTAESFLEREPPVAV